MRIIRGAHSKGAFRDFKMLKVGLLLIQVELQEIFIFLNISNQNIYLFAFYHFFKLPLYTRNRYIRHFVAVIFLFFIL